MAEGAQLKLYIGPALPLPAPAEVLDALVSASVTSATPEAPGVFQLVFELSAKSPLHTLFLVSGGAPIPMVRVSIAARVNGIESVLIDGVMTNHEISPGAGKGTSRLSVTGEDMSRVLDYIAFNGILYPAMPDFARVGLVLLKYSFLGIIPKVIPSVLLDVPLPTSRIPAQQGKDLAYVKMLAEKVGYVFMMQPGPAPGTSFAYWGPEVRSGQVQPPLDFDMDASSNVESASGSFDSQSGKLPLVIIQNPETKAPIPIPVIVDPLLNPPLGVVPPIPFNVEPIPETAKYNPVQAALIGMAKAARSAVGPVKVSGRLDLSRTGRLVEPWKLIALRGVGPAFAGLHYVEQVTTSFERGSLTQSFRLSRNGLLSTVEKVPA